MLTPKMPPTASLSRFKSSQCFTGRPSSCSLFIHQWSAWQEDAPTLLCLIFTPLPPSLSIQMGAISTPVFFFSNFAQSCQELIVFQPFFYVYSLVTVSPRTHLHYQHPFCDASSLQSELRDRTLMWASAIAVGDAHRGRYHQESH